MRAFPFFMGVATVVAQTIKLRWTTGKPCNITNTPDCGPRGPDGPWQGVEVKFGNPGYTQSMIPYLYIGSRVLTNATGELYDPNQSASAKESSRDRNEWLDPWGFDVAGKNVSGNGGDYISGHRYDDTICLSDCKEDVEIALLATKNWEISLPDGTNYTSRFGLLGLGHDGRQPNESSSILGQFKRRGRIASTSWSLHIGSVPLGQLGSLVLGGYEQNRALGEVGVFSINESRQPTMFLLDLSLGVETGGSPFDPNKELGSVWQGLGGSEAGEQATKYYGGVRGSAIIRANPVLPYIYLPPGNCEAISKYLPVTWRKELNLYVWNTDNAQYKRITNSPAYIGFTFADRTAKNITIKIPFKLLDLTLEKPIVDTPTQYFPCRPVSDTGSWILGRAFLQGAFLGLNNEENLVYLAQAPGPDMEQSVIRTHEVDDTSIMTNPAESFEKTWRSTWTIIEEDKDEDAKDEGGKDEGGKDENGRNSHPQSVSTGAIAGIVVGVVAVIIAVIVLGAFIFRRRRRVSEMTVNEGVTAEKQSTPEAPGVELAHELYSPIKIHEAPGEEVKPWSRQGGI